MKKQNTLSIILVLFIPLLSVAQDLGLGVYDNPTEVYPGTNVKAVHGLSGMDVVTPVTVQVYAKCRHCPVHSVGYNGKNVPFTKVTVGFMKNGGYSIWDPRYSIEDDEAWGEDSNMLFFFWPPR